MVRTEFPEVHLLTREKGLGYAKGASIGLEYLADRTTYVFSTTNDVEVDPEMTRQLVDYAEQNPDVGVIGTKILYHDQPDKIWHTGASSIHSSAIRGTWARNGRIIPLQPDPGMRLCDRPRVFTAIGSAQKSRVFQGRSGVLCRGHRAVLSHPETWIPYLVSAHGSDVAQDRNHLGQKPFSATVNGCDILWAVFLSRPQF